MGGWRSYAGAAGVIVAASVVCLPLRSRLQVTDIAMLFLLAVVVTAVRWPRGPALAATLLAIAAFDLGFVPPYYTFAVSDKAYFLTFGVMLIVALVMGRLTARIREQGEDAAERERRTAAAYALTRELSEHPEPEEQVAAITRHVAAALEGGTAVALMRQDDGTLRWPPEAGFRDAEIRVAAAWALDRGQPAGPGTGHAPEADACVVPLTAPSGTIGVVAVACAEGHTPDAAAWRTALELGMRAGEALERGDLARRHELSRMEVEAERLRTALLSSLSHDLRTPLATIEGSASSLLQEQPELPKETRHELAETVVHESRRMTRLVSNLLEMVRVETGGLAVRKSWQPLEEALGVALLRLDEPLRGHPVSTHLPSDLPLVPIDELLIEQVFLNLLENAAKYTQPGTPIEVTAWAENGTVVTEVSDRGPGIPAGAELDVFRKFHRVAQDGTRPIGGAGLGLTISEGIITAHGGRIWVEAGPHGGAAFRFTLPLDGPPVAAEPRLADER